MPERWFFSIVKDMEVRFTPETEKKLKDLSAQSGRGTDDLVEDATAAYVEEFLETREMLNSRYEDMKSGKVKPIPGDEVAAYFREKSAAARRTPPDSSPDTASTQKPAMTLTKCGSSSARTISTPPTG